MAAHFTSISREPNIAHFAQGQPFCKVVRVPGHGEVCKFTPDSCPLQYVGRMFKK